MAPTPTTPIRITVGDDAYRAELNDSPTARAILETLPIEASGSRWGDEIYFSIGVVRPGSTDDRAEYDVGELGYWPPGNAFCIFFGPTPASSGAQPVMASPGTPIGRVLDHVGPLRSSASGVAVRIERADG